MQADWIRRTFTPQRQMRMGVLMIWLAIPLCFFVFWTEEPPLVFEMSALALLVGGLGFVITAVLAAETSETSDNTEHLSSKCEVCGRG